MKALYRASVGRVLGGGVVFTTLLLALSACKGDDDGDGDVADNVMNGSDGGTEAEANKDDDSEPSEQEDTSGEESEDSEGDPSEEAGEETGEEQTAADSEVAETSEDGTETPEETEVEPTEASDTEASDTEADPTATEETDSTGTVTPTVPAPQCEVDSKTVSTSYCEVQETCGNQQVYSYCSMSTADTWSCSCSGTGASRAYELSGVEGSTACGVTRDLCLQGVSPEYETETDCTVSYQTASASYCDLEQTCSQRAEVSEGVTALSSAYYTSYCSSLGDGTLSCQCTGPGGTQYFTTSGVDGTTACEASVTVCSPARQTADTERDCTTSTESVSGGACSLQQSCNNTVSLPGGGTAQVTDSPYASCSVGTDDKLSCSCSADGRALSFELQSGASGGGACEESLEVCNHKGSVQAEGEIECSTPSQTASTTSCSSTLQCTQSATVDGTQIGVYGSVYTSCANITDGQWSCSCQSGNSIASFNYEAAEGADPWDACTGASDACRQQVSVQIGNGSGFIIE